jgi:hypothetical protein
MTEPIRRVTPEEAQESWVRALPSLRDRIAAAVEERKKAAAKTTD